MARLKSQAVTFTPAHVPCSKGTIEKFKSQSLIAHCEHPSPAHHLTPYLHSTYSLLSTPLLDFQHQSTHPQPPQFLSKANTNPLRPQHSHLPLSKLFPLPPRASRHARRATPNRPASLLSHADIPSPPHHPPTQTTPQPPQQPFPPAYQTQRPLDAPRRPAQRNPPEASIPPSSPALYAQHRVPYVRYGASLTDPIPRYQYLLPSDIFSKPLHCACGVGGGEYANARGGEERQCRVQRVCFLTLELRALILDGRRDAVDWVWIERMCCYVVTGGGLGAWVARWE
ncbi:hypothetical protein BDU57DRAFT_241834 [Ampelomyces quisqualis]|uniref:Uncharacterized protein n=1 Tax=Ampelomyces quisqualis TaxID=50730 RepID=A0A6A5QRW9_AMPQU|nr:hypothetical protein BDU57DRAFT_241834 [Ampelomyces quisqualis]